MINFPIHDFEVRVACHQHELLREAAMARLASQVGGQREPRIRAMVAALLYAIAARIDATAVPVAISATQRRARSISMNGTG